MNHIYKKSFIGVLLASIFSLILAYRFGTNGYEAFVVVVVATAFLATWQLYQSCTLLLRSRVWLIFKFLATLGLLCMWFVLVWLAILSVQRSVYEPHVVAPLLPKLRWFIVIFGTVSYLIPRIGSDYKKVMTWSGALVNFVMALYSLIVLFLASLNFHDTQFRFGKLSLILAVQLQYLMTFLVVETDYLVTSQEIAARLSRSMNIDAYNLGRWITICIVGLPFVAPLVVIVAVSFVR